MLTVVDLVVGLSNPDPGFRAFSPRGQTFNMPLNYVTPNWTYWAGAFSTSYGAPSYTMQIDQTVRTRWRASKGSAPVNRFTRSFGDNATERWHRSMPISIATIAGVTGSGTALLTIIGVGTGSLPVQGQGTSTLSLGTSAAGTVGTPSGVTGSGTAFLTITGVGTGSLQVRGQGTSTLGLGTSAAGAVAVRGAGTASMTLGATSAGSLAVRGTGVSALTLGTVGAGTLPIQGSGTSSLSLGATGSSATPGLQILTPDGTVAATGWSAVGAPTLQGALATGDSDYILASSAGAVATLTLSDPPTALTLTSTILRIRARQ